MGIHEIGCLQRSLHGNGHSGRTWSAMCHAAVLARGLASLLLACVLALTLCRVVASCRDYLLTLTWW
eukprot:scaffold465_cov120-Isochrysis_galbana.AAC.7